MSATSSITHQSDTANPRSHAMPSTKPIPTLEPEAPRTAADRRRWKTLAVLCLSLLMTVLDTTVVNVALPTLDRTLHASSSGLEWIVDAYTLVFAGLLTSAVRSEIVTVATGRLPNGPRGSSAPAPWSPPWPAASLS